MLHDYVMISMALNPRQPAGGCLSGIRWFTQAACTASRSEDTPCCLSHFWGDGGCHTAELILTNDITSLIPHLAKRQFALGVDMQDLGGLEAP